MIQLSFDEITGMAGSQRWRSKRSRFVPPDRLFDPSRCEAVILSESEAKSFVLQHHYSGSYPAARVRTGLIVTPQFGKPYLAGAAVFSVPMQGAAITKYLSVPHQNDGVELGRLVLLDDEYTGFNAESWFVSRSFKLLRLAIPGISGVISYSDPVPRYADDGALVKPGHAGTIYRAVNAKYHGRSRRRTLLVSKSGIVVSERAISKIRNEEVGIDYACRQLVALGAPPIMPHEPGAGYVVRALTEGGFRKISHPGNHVFSWQFKKQ